MRSKARKWVLQGNYGYGHGWQDLCASEFRTEINAHLKEYRENEGGTYRVVTRDMRFYNDTKSLTTDTTGEVQNENVQSESD